MKKLALILALAFLAIEVQADESSTTFYSDGSHSRQIGEHTFNSDGSSSTGSIGNTTFFSDGSHTRQIGDHVIRSGGESYGSYGSNPNAGYYGQQSTYGDRR